MEEEKPQEEVPPQLEEHGEEKKVAEEKAEMELEQKIPSGEKILSAIGYISFLCILPLVLKKESKYCQYHGHQALVLAIFVYFLDFVNLLPLGFAGIFQLLKYGVIIYSAYQAYKGIYHKIPFIYDLSTRFKIRVKDKE